MYENYTHDRTFNLKSLDIKNLKILNEKDIELNCTQAIIRMHENMFNRLRYYVIHRSNLVFLCILFEG